jgi:uncharacterized protein (TIGR03000 family)
MYSVVLATMLTTATAVPDWGCRGCRGCGCHSCWTCCGGCFGCSNCWGCYGCGGCYGGGCYGCGCYGCYGGNSCACYGCYGCAITGGFGAANYSYGCYGCGYGGVVISQPATMPRADNPAASLPNHATITVALPSDAQLFVDGDQVNLSTGARTFRTPQLEPGREYFYTFKAEVVRDGKTVTESKRVAFRAGEAARVEFGNLGAPAVAAARK